MEDFGTYAHEGKTVFTYRILGADSAKEIADEQAAMQAFTPQSYGRSFTYGDYTIASHGTDNLLPERVTNMYKQNAFIPEILKKKVRMLKGKGLGMFEVRETEDKENPQNIKEIRIPVSRKYAEVLNWIDSWEKNGLPSFREYINGVMFDYFYHEMYYSHPRMNLSRLTRGRLPIAGLEHKPVSRCRLAMPGILPSTEVIEDNMCNKVIVNRWNMPYRFDAKEWDRFNPADPFASDTAIMPVRDFGAGEEIYAMPTGYFGLEPSIKASNLSFTYINAYRKDAFTARKHIIIPRAWINAKEERLKELCSKNAELASEGKPIITTYGGLTEVGTQFNPQMITKLIDLKMEALVQTMSGEGENQGKTFYTASYLTEHGIEKWEIEDIPTNLKDFVDSNISVSK